MELWRGGVEGRWRRSGAARSTSPTLHPLFFQRPRPHAPDLRAAGALPPLDAPHHARADEWTPWREGVVLAGVAGAGSVVDVGLDAPALLSAPLRAGARVTVRLGEVRTAAGAVPDALAPSAPLGAIAGALAPPGEPRDAAGTYWGYTVRVAASLRDALAGGRAPYDWTVGTSERGVSAGAAKRATPFTAALVVFGGPAGLEAADPGAPALFDAWVNTCPGQGSRTIRTEEAVLVSLAVLQPALERGVAGGYGG